jgi:hypothetical protein
VIDDRIARDREHERLESIGITRQRLGRSLEPAKELEEHALRDVGGLVRIADAAADVAPHGIGDLGPGGIRSGLGRRMMTAGM